MNNIPVLDKNILTISEFEEAIKPELSPADLNALADKYRQRIDKEVAAEMLAHISEQIAEEAIAWSMTDKLLWIVREAYVLGAIEASEVTGEAIAHAAAELLEQSEIAYPIKKEK